MVNKSNYANCALCVLPGKERICLNPDGKGSVGCPTALKKSIIEKSKKQYENSSIREFARQTSIQESECYALREITPYVLHPIKTRIEEVCEFAAKMHYSKLGLVFCAGLAREAGIVANTLTTHGFEVVSVICKVGSISKEFIGVKEEEKVFIGKYESMCNPIAQALIVNDEQVQFNILLGLCVGHDSMFFKYTDAPTTVLAVKDRVMGHNPLAAVYLLDSYYERLKK